jgi:hypothetical protein
MDQHYGHINIEIIKKILVDHDQNPYSICRHIDPNVPISSKTLVSFIMVPGEGAIYIAAGQCRQLKEKIKIKYKKHLTIGQIFGASL